ncbi:MAG: hypothetical protein FWC89_14090, partial [Defluviitaleaceae bacterium]|nr:hypothetical protein [Defluviitaleaceae bacterium]
MNRFKVSLCLVTLFAILIALGACTSDTDYDPTITLPTLPPRHEIDDRTVITIAWWGSPVRHERTLAVLQMFEEQNPTIRFEAEYFSFDAYLTELAARAAADD